MSSNSASPPRVKCW